MKKLFQEFFKEKIEVKSINEDFDYSFNKENDIEKFKIEFRKFLHVYEAFYYNNRLVTVFNSNEIRINYNDLKLILYLYIYADINNLHDYKKILQEFLISYNNTLNSKEYQTNRPDHKEAKTEFKSLLNELKVKQELFVDSKKSLYDFYKEIIIFSLKNEIFINGEIINRIFQNLMSLRCDCNDIVELFLANKKCIYNVIIYDLEKSKHLSIYYDYIRSSLESFGGYNYAKEIIVILDKSKCLNLECINKIINLYINVTNELVDKLKEKDYSFIQGLSQIENLKKEFIYLLANIESFEHNHKEKIRECLSRLLTLKRFIVSDNEYVKSEMHESKYEQTLPKKEVEAFRKSLFSNKFALYSASKIKFTSEIGYALESYAQHPLLSLVSRYTIDSRREVYSLHTEEINKIADNNFKNYFDKIGKKYTMEHDNLLNKLGKDYYEELLKYISTTFQLHQNLLISMISKEELECLFNDLKSSIGYDFDNEYAIIVSNILAIEVNVIKILEKNNIKIENNGFKNLNKLFMLNINDEEKVDGIMYLNYILYEKSGLNLRNNAMHGTLIHENLTTALIVTFSGLIFVSWLLNE